MSLNAVFYKSFIIYFILHAYICTNNNSTTNTSCCCSCSGNCSRCISCRLGLRRLPGARPLLRGKRRQAILQATHRLQGKGITVCWVRWSSPWPVRVGNVTSLSRRALCLHVLSTAAWSTRHSVQRVPRSTILSLLL